jgi:hypothetical protein
MEDKFHAYNEGMVNLIQDFFLQVKVLNRVMLNYNILADAFHCV